MTTATSQEDRSASEWRMRYEATARELAEAQGYIAELRTDILVTRTDRCPQCDGRTRSIDAILGHMGWAYYRHECEDCGWVDYWHLYCVRVRDAEAALKQEVSS